MMETWTIYDHPRDIPHCFVARKFVGLTPTSDVIIHTELGFIRGLLQRMGLVCLTRSLGDDPKIIETWL